MTIDLTKPIQTRNGLTARIVSTNLHGMYPIAAVVDRGDGYEYVAVYTDKGAYYASGVHESNLDLINVPVKHTREIWLNMYEKYCTTYLDRDQANICAGPGRIACIQVTIEFEEGDGL